MTEILDNIAEPVRHVPVLPAETLEALSPRAAQRGEYLFSKSELARWQLEAPSRWQGRVTYVD